MKRVILVIFLYSLAFCASAKTLSSSNTIALETPADIQDLALLGKTWGFLKYHHPEVAKGKFNWDDELISFIPRYLSIPEEQKDALLLEWIDQLGPVQKCDTYNPVNANAYLQPDFKWIELKGVSEALRNKIQMIRANRYQGKNYYVSFAPSVGNPEFLNEPSYGDQTYPNTELRLLALFRLWNIVHYFYPYRHQTEKDWDDFLSEYIVDIVEAPDELTYELVMLRFLSEIHDTHANLWRGGDAIEDWKGRFFPPVRMSMVENKLVVTDFYISPNKADIGLGLGDVITQIEGVPVETMIKERLPYYPASNLPTKLRDLAPDLLRSNKKQLIVTIKKVQGTAQQTLTLYKKAELPFFYGIQRKDFSEIPYRFLSDDIGYVDLKSILDADIEKIKTKFSGTKGIIIDIRNYPNVFLPFKLGPYFVQEKTPFVKFTKANPSTPGEFDLTSTLDISPREKTYTGELVILVNEVTQSMAEYTTMAFQARPNTTVIGSTTAGADGNISEIPLPGGLLAAISGIGIYYPDGKETQRIGIVPDIVVYPTIDGIKERRDELLEEAVRVINEKT